MDVHIQEIQCTDASRWEAYVHSHPRATLYHLYGWRNVIEKTYGHSTYYLAAIKDVTSKPSSIQHPVSSISFVGILPLVHLKSFLFGNTLLSLPYVDLGGILADDEKTEYALLRHAIELGEKLKATTIELRHAQPLSCLSSINSYPVVTRSHKVRMLLDLPDSPEKLMGSFKSKLRSQIKKPLKEGLTARIGGCELLKDFYGVFAINMKDLGSPVHSCKLMAHVHNQFPNDAKIIVVYGDSRPLAASLIIGFRDTLQNPWASSLRAYSHLSPNMCLYWRMLEYACNNGFTTFDFGRSTPGEGTFKFKEQWGAKPYPLHWHYISLTGKALDEAPLETSRFETLIKYWQKLPVPVTRLAGPIIRKHIGL